MTSAILAATESQSSSHASQSVSAPPRKRRRRTGGNAAGDDCFTCSKRAVQCDRKRPYCSQCIEIGKECAGYKTTLTWGVGVASRGKLRGLSCPIANKNSDGSDVSVEQMAARRRKSSGAASRRQSAATTTPVSPKTITMQLPPTTNLPPPTPAVQNGSQALPLPIPNPQMQYSWTPPHQPPELADVRPHRRNGSVTLDPIHTSLALPLNSPAMAMSSGSLQSYAPSEYATPLEFPSSANTFSFDSPESHAQQLPPIHHINNSFAQNGTLELVMEGSPEENYNSYVPTSGNTSIGTMQPMDFGNEDMMFGQLDDSTVQFSHYYDEDEHSTDSRSLAVMNARFGNPFAHLPIRIQTLFDYYDRNICPFIVAFDTPVNPYRMHVLQLAMHNEALQNAIAALAMNNMRMRMKTPKQIGFVEEITSGFEDSPPSHEIGPTREESCYKQMSIDQLNMQLTDISAAQDDSVLATLLILCLFHVCDSGFSKFKTQLAGVQKLLSMRTTREKSGFEGWVEMFFTWFDVMTSTVNDREVQIQGESMDMLNFSTNLGALEEFSGCDGRLFKLIARLGRLNLLAQGRPVRGRRNNKPHMRSDMLRMRSTAGRSIHHTMNSNTNSSLDRKDYAHLDGNGWGAPIISDDDGDGSANDNNNDQVMQDSSREEFWSEWNDIRSRLQSWEMDWTTLPAPPQATSLDSTEIGLEQRDLAHISEAFRYSALLYTERLGHPLLPSSHPQFQTLVSRTLEHITPLDVTSCVNKFLLWPLFIVGTECVDEGHRNVIRSRCIEVQRESGFYNNLSGLEVLEKVWREVGNTTLGGEAAEINGRRRDSQVKRDGRFGQAFRWRKAMDRVDGEYILI